MAVSGLRDARAEVGRQSPCVSTVTLDDLVQSGNSGGRSKELKKFKIHATVPGDTRTAISCHPNKHIRSTESDRAHHIPGLENAGRFVYRKIKSNGCSSYVIRDLLVRLNPFSASLHASETVVC